MEQSVVVTYKQYIKTAIIMFAGTVFQGFLFYYLRENFVENSRMLLVALVILEVLCDGYFLLRGLTVQRLDKNGLTVKNPFATKIYLWDEVSQYGVERVQYQERGLFGKKYKYKPRFCLHFGSKKIHIEYREDTKSCLRTYCGLPAYNKYEEQ